MVFHQPHLKNMRKSKLDYLTPSFGVEIKTTWSHHLEKNHGGYLLGPLGPPFKGLQQGGELNMVKQHAHDRVAYGFNVPQEVG